MADENGRDGQQPGANDRWGSGEPLPWTKWYWRDWLSAPAIRRMSPDQRGRFMDVFATTHGTDTPGVMTEDDVRAQLTGTRRKLEERDALILDPMLATGGTLIATIDMLKRAGAKRIKGIFLVAAPEGLAALEAAHPDVEVYTAAIDQRLDARGYILPGLGDAGDRIFGTRL